MDANLKSVIQARIDRTLEALKKNRFEAQYIATPAELLKTLDELVPEGSSCSVGGSVTLKETGVLDYLTSGRFNYFDRYAAGADENAVFHQALSCDYYFTGSNALTMDGKLYNIDGRGNRLAALCYGPSKVLVIAGYNKIVTDIDAARDRMRGTAAPANGARLGKSTPCVSTGYCQDCRSPGRMCSQELTTGWQAIPGRIHVFLLGGEYGY